jgi:tRNA G18 (ribose-2'-O)-methylase SpoU
MGAALRVPFATMPEWPGDLRRLRDAGFAVLAMTPAGDAVAVRDVVQRFGGASAGAAKFSAAARVALLLGHEGHGLSDAALEAADARVRIPMAGGVDSLNVATAAALALYELSR